MKRSDHHLVQQVLDGEVSAEEFDGFQERMRKEPELVDLYKGYSLLQHALSEEFEDGLPSREFAEGGGRRSWKAGLLLLACALAAVAALAWTLTHVGPWAKTVAGAATFSEDAVWRIKGASTNEGASTGISAGGTLHLRQGRASISLEPAVAVLLEGPAVLTLDSKNKLHLRQGRAWFRAGASSDLSVHAPTFTVDPSEAAFGIDCPNVGTGEIQMLSGHARVAAVQGAASLELDAGSALRVADDGKLQAIPSVSRGFANHLGHFETVIGGPFVREDWRLDFGNPTISEKRIEGLNFTAFRKLPRPEPSEGNTVLLVTLDVAKPSNGVFHTDGWAGMSFFSGETEMLFFGDSFGTRNTWSLDVKQRLPVVLPEGPVLGPRTVTLRYDSITGEVSLHDGSAPLKAPFCVGKLPAGAKFDGIRIGASAGAALAVDSLEIRVGGN